MNPDRITRPVVDFALHPAWDRYVRALQSAGLASELALFSLPERLGSIASRPPESASKAALLDSYYRGDGGLESALRRTLTDRRVAHHAMDCSTAQEFVARVRLAARELGSIALIEDEAGPGLMLRTANATARIAQISVVRRGMTLVDPLHGHRVVDVRAVVAAANELLEKRRFGFRFLPLDAALGVDAFVAVDPTDALLLEDGRVLERSLEELRDFARWDRGPLIAIGAAG